MRKVRWSLMMLLLSPLVFASSSDKQGNGTGDGAISYDGKKLALDNHNVLPETKCFTESICLQNFAECDAWGEAYTRRYDEPTGKPSSYVTKTKPSFRGVVRSSYTLENSRVCVNHEAKVVRFKVREYFDYGKYYLEVIDYVDAASAAADARKTCESSSKFFKNKYGLCEVQ